MKRYAWYTAGLIALYLVVSKSNNAAGLIGAGVGGAGSGAVGLITALQGR